MEKQWGVVVHGFDMPTDIFTTRKEAEIYFNRVKKEVLKHFHKEDIIIEKDVIQSRDGEMYIDIMHLDDLL